MKLLVKYLKEDPKGIALVKLVSVVNLSSVLRRDRCISLCKYYKYNIGTTE